jgi:hypothetical protein
MDPNITTASMKAVLSALERLGVNLQTAGEAPAGEAPAGEAPAGEAPAGEAD